LMLSRAYCSLAFCCGVFSLFILFVLVYEIKDRVKPYNFIKQSKYFK
jgi:hypothetical protein